MQQHDKLRKKSRVQEAFEKEMAEAAKEQKKSRDPNEPHPPWLNLLHRDPNKPYPISAEYRPWYTTDTVGHFYADQLLSIAANNKFWDYRMRSMKSYIDAGDDMVKSTIFREAVLSGNVHRLKAVSNVAYLMKAMGEDAWLVPDNVPQEEADAYWTDVWRWCSVSGDNLLRPAEWGKISLGDYEEL